MSCQIGIQVVELCQTSLHEEMQSCYLPHDMISDELRNSKPYAVPVRFLPYHSITDAKLRELETELGDAMLAVNMLTVDKHTSNKL